MKAGAKGAFYPAGNGQSWEPDYGDPVFLDRLDNFHRAFASRYGSQPWLEFVDIGSYGEWGEGHTLRSSKKDWPVDVIKKHIDIHVRNYPETFILMNDNMVNCRRNEEGWDEIVDYAVAQGLGLRDNASAWIPTQTNSDSAPCELRSCSTGCGAEDRLTWNWNITATSSATTAGRAVCLS